MDVISAGKLEDRLQFATNLAPPRSRSTDPASPLETGSIKLGSFPLSNIELIQNDFVFQSRPSGDGPALLEQSFTLVIHCPPTQPVLPRKALPVWAKRVIESGRGNMVLDLPVGLLGPT